MYINNYKDVVNNNISNKFFTSEFGDSFLSDEDFLYYWSFPNLLNMYCGVNNKIYMEDKLIENIKKLDTYKNMTTYPNEGSIKIVDGELIVKID